MSLKEFKITPIEYKSPYNIDGDPHDVSPIHVTCLNRALRLFYLPPEDNSGAPPTPPPSPKRTRRGSRSVTPRSVTTASTATPSTTSPLDAGTHQSPSPQPQSDTAATKQLADEVKDHNNVIQGDGAATRGSNTPPESNVQSNKPGDEGDTIDRWA